MIILDYSSIAMSSIMPRIAEFEDNVDLIRHQIFNTIRMYNAMFKEEYGELVIAMDGTKNWRKDYFPNYKAKRRESRKNSVHDWNLIFTELGKVTEDIKKSSPYRCIQVDTCEADDVIGTIVAQHMSPEPILIISPDKDFVQLHKYPNVKQYSNIQKKFVESDVDPETDLWTKILKGDTGDGVPNVMSDDDVFITEGARQNKLTKAKMDLLREDPEALGTSVARRIIRNRTLVDLERTPDEIKKEIMSHYGMPARGNIMSLMTLFTKHQMKMMLESLQDFEVSK